jgi:hypothetical protein
MSEDGRLTGLEVLVSAAEGGDAGAGTGDVVIVDDVGPAGTGTIAGDVATTSSPVVYDLTECVRSAMTLRSASSGGEYSHCSGSHFVPSPWGS